MVDGDTLLAEIDRLLERADDGDDPAELAGTLTDGYARALHLEGERTRLRKRIAELTASIGGEGSPATIDELSALVVRLGDHEAAIASLRGKLERLRARHSSAVRAPAR